MYNRHEHLQWVEVKIWNVEIYNDRYIKISKLRILK